MTTTIRLATEQDADQVLEIYAPFCRESPVSFELQPPTLDEMRARMRSHASRYPWLVFEKEGKILGYVYARPFRERAAYQWSVEVTAYIREGHRRSGIGRALYTALFRLLVMQNYCNAYAGITLPNAGSVRLHEAMGFQPVGIFRRAGYKCGVWHDVGWWQLSLQEHPAHPEPPKDVASIQESAGVSAP